MDYKRKYEELKIKYDKALENIQDTNNHSYVDRNECQHMVCNRYVFPYNAEDKCCKCNEIIKGFENMQI
jgi:hypothetical protein